MEPINNYMHASTTNSARLTPTEMDQIDYNLAIIIIHINTEQN